MLKEKKRGRKGEKMFFSLTWSPLVLLLAVVSMGKFGIICVFAIIHLHAAELFPTVLRTTGMGSASVFARFGSMLAPVVGRELGKVHPIATIVIFAFLSMIAGFLTLWLPETRGLKMIDTIEEAEALKRDLLNLRQFKIVLIALFI